MALTPIWAAVVHGLLAGVLCAAAEVPITIGVVGIYDFLFASTPIGGPLVALFWCSMVLLFVVASLSIAIISAFFGRSTSAPRHNSRGG